MNVYEQNNASYYNLLILLIKKYPYCYKKIIYKQYSYLYEWILLNTKFIVQHNNDFVLRVEWILSGRLNFPICKICGNKITDPKRFSGSILHGYYDTCSKKCMKELKAKRTKKTISKDIDFYKKRQEKTKQTCMKKYNVENAWQAEIFKTKSRLTKLKKYGNENYTNIILSKKTIFLHKVNDPDYVQKINIKKLQTYLKHYGTKHNMQSSTGYKEYVNAILKKYNVENISLNTDIKEKIKLTCLKKYGVDYITQSKEFKTLSKKTMLKKYGVEHSMLNHNIRVKTQQKYFYDNRHFDSAPEIAYYIWLKDNNIDFEYQPNKAFEYEADGKKHFYMPDFRVEDQYVELKGDQFLKEDGTWQNPYDHKQDNVFEAKHQCALKNNVKILYSNEYKKYIDYISTTYKKDYLLQFKK